jgi:hypothetical protein
MGVMYLSVRGIDLASFYDCNIGLYNCFDIELFPFSILLFSLQQIVTVMQITSISRGKCYVGYATHIAISKGSTNLSSPKV